MRVALRVQFHCHGVAASSKNEPTETKGLHSRQPQRARVFASAHVCSTFSQWGRSSVCRATCLCIPLMRLCARASLVCKVGGFVCQSIDLVMMLGGRTVGHCACSLQLTAHFCSVTQLDVPRSALSVSSVHTIVDAACPYRPKGVYALSTSSHEFEDPDSGSLSWPRHTTTK